MAEMNAKRFGAACGLGLLLAAAGCDRGTGDGPARLEVSAGEDFTVEPGETATLRAGVRGHRTGFAFRWSQLSGPSVLIADEISPVTEAGPFSEVGDHKFRVIASNQAGAFGQDFVTVTVSPVELQGDVENLALVGEPITLAASASNFNNADLEFAWRVVSGDATLDDALVRKPVATVHSLGTAEFEVIATGVIDDLERTGRLTVFVTTRRDKLNPSVVIDVEGFGEIPLELYAEAAPVTVANFLHYVDDAHYDGQIFHRVIADFIIQAGGFDADQQPVDPRDPIPNEADNGLSNLRGTVAVALLPDEPESGAHGFFVNLSDDNTFLDENLHTVFGTVVGDGMEVADQIAQVETDADEFPLEPVVIKAIRRVETDGDGGG